MHRVIPPPATPANGRDTCRDTFRDPSLVEVVRAALARAGHEAPLREVRRGPAGSNELTEVRFGSGPSLMVKRGRYDWDRLRFRASRLAADLLRRRTGVIAPRHVDIGEAVDGRAVEAYWRIELPTLRERWPSLSDRERPRALRSWGELLRRVHTVRLAGHGPLARAVRQPSTLAAFLAEELGERLPPSVAAWWPAAWAPLQALRTFVLDVSARVGHRPGVLLHNDPHLGNVLCEWRGHRFRCGGVLDLEAAMGGPPESDLAHVQVLHGPLLGEPLPRSWFEHVLAGYGAPADPAALAFFRAYHLLNLGVHAAMVGLAGHAADVARAAATEVTEVAALAERTRAARAPVTA